MMVGETLDEAMSLSCAHQDLCDKLRARKSKITEHVLMREAANDLSLLWEPAERQLNCRDSLLQQSIRFHQAADSVSFFRARSI